MQTMTIGQLQKSLSDFSETRRIWAREDAAKSRATPPKMKATTAPPAPERTPAQLLADQRETLVKLAAKEWQLNGTGECDQYIRRRVDELMRPMDAAANKAAAGASVVSQFDSAGKPVARGTAAAKVQAFTPENFRREGDVVTHTDSDRAYRQRNASAMDRFRAHRAEDAPIDPNSDDFKAGRQNALDGIDITSANFLAGYKDGLSKPEPSEGTAARRR